MPTKRSCKRLIDRMYVESLSKRGAHPAMRARGMHARVHKRVYKENTDHRLYLFPEHFRGAHPSLTVYLPKAFQRTAHPAVGGSGVHAQVRGCIGRGAKARRLARQRRTAVLGRDRVARDAHRALLRLQLDAYLRRSHLHYAPAVAPAHCGTCIESLVSSLHHYIRVVRKYLHAATMGAFGSMEQWDALPLFVTMLLQLYLQARRSGRTLCGLTKAKSPCSFKEILVSHLKTSVREQASQFNPLLISLLCMSCDKVAPPSAHLVLLGPEGHVSTFKNKGIRYTVNIIHCQQKQT